MKTRTPQESLCTVLRTIATIALLFCAPAGLAAEYFVDVTTGNDQNSGSEEEPWKTLSHARSRASSGDTIHVSGTGTVEFEENTPDETTTDYLTFVADPDNSPVLRGIRIRYTNDARSYLRFEGFTIRTDGANNVVDVRNASRVILKDSVIESAWPAYDESGVIGIRIRGSRHIQITNNRVRTVHRAIQIGSSDSVQITNNYLTPVDGTGIQWVGGNNNGLISGNHIHQQDLEGYPGGPGTVPDPHASIISVRSSNLDISGNLLHGMGSSSGIMFYPPDAAGSEEAYSNITLENNAIYDVSNSYALRIYNLGDNVNIRNNLLFSRYRRQGDCQDGVTPDSRYRYQTALQVHTLADGFDGSGLSLHNNILIGRVSVPQTAQEGNNFIWSLQVNGDWLDRSLSGTSEVITASYNGCGNHPRTFESGTFFTEGLSPARQSVPHPTSLFLSEQSRGIDFGDPRKQPDRTIGTLLESGFLAPAGAVRTSDIHSVGPFPDPRQQQAAPNHPTGLHSE